MKRRKVVEVGDKGSGVSAYLPCLSFSLFFCPPGMGEEDESDAQSVCVFRGYDMLLSPNKSHLPPQGCGGVGASSQQSLVSFWKFCVCSGACLCALFKVDSWILSAFER